MGYMVNRKHRDFTDEDIQRLADTFSSFQDGTLEDVKGFVLLSILRRLKNKIIFLLQVDMLVLKLSKKMRNHLMKK